MRTPKLMYLIVCFLTSCTLLAQDDNTLFFESDVRPILKAHCFYCHGEDGEMEGDVDLRQVRFMLDASAIDADSPSASRLLEVVATGEMPIEGKPLESQDVDTIRRWLSSGYKTKRIEPPEAPDFYITDSEQSHWGFNPVVKPQVPDVGQANPIDAFIQAAFSEKNLNFAVAADRITLIRRASFDLLGLPPTPKEIDAFVQDDSPDAWSRLIDQLLQSPAYGERWGRHWLDVVGYSDSNGGDLDSPRDHAWQYRDYVVRAINENKPWDRFIQEQLAGDELVGLTSQQTDTVIDDPEKWDIIAATGFLRMAPDTTADRPDDPSVAKEEVLVNTIRIIGNSLLGLTLQCAQCHDHRFDPISQVDYFRIRSLVEPVFNPADWREPQQREYEAYTAQELETNRTIEASALAIDAQRKALINRVYAEYLEVRMGDTDEATKNKIRLAWNKPVDERSEGERELLKKFDCDFEIVDHLRFIPNTESSEALRVELLRKAEEIRATKLSRTFMAATENPSSIPQTRRFHRGNPAQPREVVSPGDLQIFEARPIIKSNEENLPTTGRRLAYTQWLTSGHHPLVARVLTNRFWMHHFGQGIVTTTEDFGMRTPRPLHGDLLDYLAQWFVDANWDLKSFHRLVMTSKTYQQANRNLPAESIDGSNQYFARMSLRRLEAEVVRDSMLAVSGKLVCDIGGRPAVVARNPAGGIELGKEISEASNGVVKAIEPLGEQAYRRSIYVQLRRERTLSVLEAFDMPNMAPNCSQRVCSTNAPQSLMMLNNTFVVEQSRAFAERLISEPGDASVHIGQLWRLTYGRDPSSDELATAVNFLTSEQHRQRLLSNTEELTRQVEVDALAAICQVVFASNEFLYTP